MLSKSLASAAIRRGAPLTRPVRSLPRRPLSTPSGGTPVTEAAETVAKDARLNRMKRIGAQPAGSSGGGGISGRGVVAVASCFALGYAIFDVKTNREGALGQMYTGSQVETAMNWLYEQTFGQFEDAFLPTSDALLPTWPSDPYYAAIPPGTPVPPLLVLDLEKTCIASEYDARDGWRHVKRPGLDKFIQQLSSYYEIAIISENDVNVQEQLLLAIDPENRTFKLGPTAAELRDNVYLKRLDFMNRDIRRIVLLDDDQAASALFPRNTLLVKPYTDVHDRSDSTLLDLVPFLQALVHEQCDDYRDTIDALGTHDAADIATEYQMRISKKKQQELKARNRGLGGMARSVLSPRITEVSESARTSLIPSATQLVGSTGEDIANYKNGSKLSAEEEKAKGGGVEFRGKVKTDIGSNTPQKKGRLFEKLAQIEKDNSEMDNLRKEKMNEIYAKRMMGGK
jgi:hypothetical protein